MISREGVVSEAGRDSGPVFMGRWHLGQACGHREVLGKEAAGS